MAALRSVTQPTPQSVRPAEYAGESGIAGIVRDEPADVRVSALDGLRAIAILLVIAHNAGSVSGALDSVLLRLWAVVSNAGWVGVQLFFALSGFLITRILLRGKGEPGWLRSFYLRRLLRIVPLYYAFLLVIFGVAPHLALLRRLSEPTAIPQAWYWLYLANWSAPLLGTRHGLPHLWSLSVEEQFYLLWPVVVAFTNERVLAMVGLVVVVAALAARVALHALLPPEVASSAAYTWTVCRADTIVLGAFVALALRSPRIVAWLRAHFRSLILTVFLAALLATAVQRGFPAMGSAGEVVNQPLSGLFSALIVLGCVCGPLPARQGSEVQAVLQRWLSAPWLTTIGKYSYAIYMVHLPVTLLLRARFEPLLVQGGGTRRFLAHIGYTGIVLAVSLAIALVTWSLIERPFLSLKRFYPMPARRDKY